MTDCTKCKHLYLKQMGKYTAISDCDLDMLIKRDDGMLEMPKECSGFEEHIEGKKYDEGKNRMGLVLQGFSNALWEVGRVGTFGANKYGENNWMYLDNAKSRYLDALCRHLFQYMEGYYYDGESKLPHLAHMCWNALALLKFESELTHEPPKNDKCSAKEFASKVADARIEGLLKGMEDNNAK